MKAIFYTLTALFMLSSCTTSRDYLLRAEEDKTLFDIVKRLNKKSDDPDASSALATVYKKVQEKHLKKITIYQAYTDIGRWDKLYQEYEALQEMFEAIDNSAAALSLVTPTSYRNELMATREGAAVAYYELGDALLHEAGRENAKKAHAAFKKAGSWVKNFKDSQQKMEEAYNNSILNVVINPIQDNSFFYNAGWGNTGYNYSNDYFQRNLVRDLGGQFSGRYPARFFTDLEAGGSSLQPDWVIDLTLRNMDIPRPSVQNTNRNVSRNIQVGSDSTGKPIYKTVQATLKIQRQYFNARAQMDLQIMEWNSRKNIAYNSFSDNYNWQQEMATYTGDKRALSDEHWALVNNRVEYPQREAILNRLYSKIYPQVRNRIEQLVHW